MPPETFIDLGDGVPRDAATVTHPSDRTFRDAWQLNGTIIDIDMIKARDLHRAGLRLDRLARFDPYDKIATPLARKAAGGSVLSAQEKADLNAAEAAAQKLRDAPNHASITAATTPDTLKALTLDALIV